MPAESDTDQDELDREISAASPDTADLAAAPPPAADATDGDDIEDADDEETEEEYEEDITLTELRDEIAAGTAENRRTARRTFDVLKQFGAVLDAMSGTVNDLHRSARSATQSAPAASVEGGGMPRAHLLGLVELADRLARLGAAFDRRPAAATSWWPATRTALTAWDAAWDMQRQAFSILSLHVDGLLSSAGLERMDALGQPFDPVRMTAVETAQDSTQPDHTVLAELLPGWQRGSTAEVIRTAQVRVSRR